MIDRPRAQTSPPSRSRDDAAPTHRRARIMHSPNQGARAATPPPRLRIFEPAVPTPSSGVRWLIDGFPAIILLWTQEQWASLRDRPSDAQYHPAGVWLALRME